MKMTCQNCGADVEGERPELKSDPDTLTFLIPLCHPCFERARARFTLMLHAKSN